MDYPSLISALPAETVTAVGTTPQGLTANSQVVVSEVPPNATSTSRAWWRIPPEYTSHGPIAGGVVVSYEFDLLMSKSGGTNAEMEIWAEQIRAHFDGRPSPASITDMLAAGVKDIIIRVDEHGGDAECMITIAFVGVKRPGTT